MSLVYGTAGLALAVLFFGITLIGSRQPVEPIWAKGFLVACIYAPAIVALVAVGAACLVQFMLSIGSQAFGLKELLLEIGVVAVGLILLTSLRINQRLASFEAARKSAEIIKPDAFFQAEKDRQPHEPPESGASGKIAA